MVRVSFSTGCHKGGWGQETEGLVHDVADLVSAVVRSLALRGSYLVSNVLHALS